MFKTILTTDWLKNNLDLSLNFSTTKEAATYKDYYLKICQIIYDNFYLKLMPSDIEEYIADGKFEYDENNTITCGITTLADRQYLFLLAQAKQLQYEKFNGIGGMIADGNAQLYKVCPEVIGIIKQLGLYQRSFAVV